MTTRNKRLAQVGSGLLAVGLLVIIIRSLAAGPPDIARPADAQKAQRVAKGSAQPADAARTGSMAMVAGNGIVEPNGREIKVAGQSSGRIARVAVKEGLFVDEGAVLVELESATEKAAVAAAEADVAQAQAELQRTMHGQRREDVDALIDEASAAEERAESSKLTFQRTEALAKGGGATADELDKAKHAYGVDEATAKAAGARRRAALAGSREEDVLAARAKLESARAKRDQARTQVERLSIRAPIAGEVLQVRYRPGEYYNPSGVDPIVIIGDTRHLNIRMDVEERDIANVRVGQASYALADAFGERKFTGKVIEVGRRMGRKNVRTDDPTERKDTKILEVVIQLDTNEALVPGQRVTAFIATAGT